MEENVITIKLEVKTATDKGSFSSKRKRYNVCLTNERMKNLNVNLKQSANYLIQLFYKTGQAYSCTRTKIGKLLSIVAFVYARKGEKVFDETIYKYNDCGTAFLELKALVDREVYLIPTRQDDRSFINITLNEDAKIPDMHQRTDLLSDDIKKTIENVFRTFGAYSADDLGNELMLIIGFQNMINDKNEVNLSHFPYLQLSDFIDNKDSALIQYLLKNTDGE